MLNVAKFTTLTPWSKVTNHRYQNTLYHNFKNLHLCEYIRFHWCTPSNALSTKLVQCCPTAKPHVTAMWRGLCPLLYWREEQDFSVPWPYSTTRTINDDQGRTILSAQPPSLPAPPPRLTTIPITTNKSYDRNFLKEIINSNYYKNAVKVLFRTFFFLFR
jgi:hypothetical protein